MIEDRKGRECDPSASSQEENKNRKEERGVWEESMGRGLRDRQCGHSGKEDSGGHIKIVKIC